MFAVINNIEIKPEHASEVDQLFERNAQMMKECPGFKSMTLLTPQGNPGSRRVFALWESPAAYEAYKKSDVFRKTHADVNMTWFMGPPKVQKMNVVFALP